AVMLRYTAATAAGASVTCCILLMLTALMPPSGAWGVRLVEQAGAALGAWELERPRRYRHSDARRGGAWGDRNAVPAQTAPAVTPGEAASGGGRTEPRAAEDERSAPQARDDGGVPPAGEARARAVLLFESPRQVRNGQRPRLAELRRPAELDLWARSSFETAGRVMLADVEPSVNLGFERLLSSGHRAHEEAVRE